MLEKSYAEMRRLETFADRYEYLSLKGRVGEETYGSDRYLNQRFYRSKEWRDLRNRIIVRDNGCDLATPGFEIHGRILIHHINPIGLSHIMHSDDLLFNPDNLVCVTHDTHNAIHYGDASLLPKPYVGRRRGDTKLW